MFLPALQDVESAMQAKMRMLREQQEQRLAQQRAQQEAEDK